MLTNNISKRFSMINNIYILSEGEESNHFEFHEAGLLIKMASFPET